MRNDFPERKLFSILRSDQFLLDRGNIRFVLDMLVPKLVGDVLGGCSLACAGSASDKEIFLVGLELGLEGDVVLDLPALHFLEEVDGAVEALAELVVFGLDEVREQLEGARVALELVELFGLPGVVGEDDLVSVEVLEDHGAQDLHLLGLWLALVGLPTEDGLDVEDIEQQAVGVLDVLPHDFPLLGLVHVGVDEFGQQFLADVPDDGVDLLLSGDGVEAGLLLEDWHNCGLTVEVILSAGEFSPLVLEVHNLEVEVGFEDGDFCGFRGEVHQDVVFVFGVLADEVVGSDWRVDELVADVAEVVLVERFKHHLAGAVEDDQLRVELLPEGCVADLAHELGPPDHLVLPLHCLLLGRVLPPHENHSNLRLPLLHRPEELDAALDYEPLLLVLVQSGL